MQGNFFTFPNGGVSVELVISSMAKNGIDISVPEDLMNFWNCVGGGDFFETETFLSPVYDAKKENVFEFSKALWMEGMPEVWLCVYAGAWGYGVITQGESSILLLNVNDFSVSGKISFTDLIKNINDEFTGRYDGYTIQW